MQSKLAPLVAGAVVVEEGTRTPGALGLAWCPTPSALDRLRAAGADPGTTPSFEILRRVNHRRFSFEMGETLPGERWASSVDEIDRATRDGGAWLVKAAYGFAGRGRVLITRGITAADGPRLARALAAGGAQLEPRVDRVADWAVHGFLAADGSLARGALTRQECDEHGAWVTSVRCEGASLEVPFWDELERVGAALHAAGYFGPFGIDGFTWIDAHGTERVRVRSEINARYSMGWATGMGAVRPDLAADSPRPGRATLES